MEGEEEEGAGVTTRIFVGGLGGSVTAGDLEKTFSSLGTVRSVDIVRTNGRSFAYMDFQPSSNKSLPKLFSMYNGCIWKGGRLRLEKAKDHYLVRLRREWAEDAELANHAPNNDLLVDKTMASSEKSKLLTTEKMQLQIFFPRLSKVKSLPYSGTGKHKYSFQRIEVPSLPIHFCDCEEHCGPETATEGRVSVLETQTGGINEEELNMMKSVMTKIFKREVNSGTSYDGTTRAMEGDNSTQPIDDVLFDKSKADQDTDADNLVINMVSGGNGRLGLMENLGRGTISADWESKFKRQLSNDGPMQNQLKAQKRKNTEPFNSSDSTLKKKPRLLPADESSRDEFASTKPKKKVSWETHSEESKSLTEDRPNDHKASIHQSTRGFSWTQKSSWRELVGETANKSFSISHILPETASTKQNLPKCKGLDTADSTDRKQLKLVKQSRSKSNGESSKALGVGNDRIPQDEVTTASDSIVVPSETPSKEFTSMKQNLPKCKGLDTADTTDSKQLKLVKQSRSKSNGESSKALGVGKDRIPQDEVATASDSIVAPSETPSKESEGPIEAEPADKNVRGLSWTQKSSWRELVGETANSSFSISNVLPGIASKIQNLPKSVTANSIDGKQQNLEKQLRNESTGDVSKAFGVGKDGILQHKVNAPGISQLESLEKEEGIVAGLGGDCNMLQKNPENEEDDNNASSKASENKSHRELNKKAMGQAGIGEICTFMRSGDSEREWTKTRAALSGSLKKKSNEN